MCKYILCVSTSYDGVLSKRQQSKIGTFGCIMHIKVKYVET